MYRYRVRPGHGSKKLLVEFMSDSSDEAFLAALRSVFSANGIKAKRKEDLLFLFRTVMDSPAGSFEVDHDEWSMVWIHADDNQNVIPYLDRVLAASGQFQKEEVNLTQYERAQPSATPNGGPCTRLGNSKVSGGRQR
jgi:hypothetical protein